MEDQRQMIDDEIDLIELLGKIWNHKVLVTTLTLAMTILSIFAVNMMRPRYKVSATVIPNSKEFFKVYSEDLRAIRKASEMKIISGDISVLQYTNSINPFFLSKKVVIDTFNTISTFDSSIYESVEDQVENEFKITTKTKDNMITIDIIHFSPEIALKFTNELINQVNKKLNDNFSPGKSLHYLIVTDPPSLPRKPDSPKKLLVIAVTFISSLFLSIFLALFIEWIQDAKLQSNRKGKRQP